MAYNVELLKADVLDELEKIGLLIFEFEKVRSKIELPPDQVSYYDRGAIGYLLHNFYNGCEAIFNSIARFFENDLARDAWHKDLLKRMKIEVTGYRPKVIDQELFQLLDDFRSFRHKFRHSYAFQLDWEREQVVARKLIPTHELLNQQITLFLGQLEGIGGEP